MTLEDDCRLEEIDMSEPRRDGPADEDAMLGVGRNDEGGAARPVGRREVATDDASEWAEERRVGRGVVRRMYEISGEGGRADRAADVAAAGVCGIGVRLATRGVA